MAGRFNQLATGTGSPIHLKIMAKRSLTAVRLKIPQGTVIVSRAHAGIRLPGLEKGRRYGSNR